MDVGEDLIGMFKKNIKLLYKWTIENLTKDWLGGSYLVLRIMPMMPGGRLITAIGYRNNECKVLYFIVTDNTWTTNSDIPYLSNYPELFLMFTFALLLIPLSFISSLDLLMIYTPQQTRAV